MVLRHRLHAFNGVRRSARHQENTVLIVPRDKIALVAAEKKRVSGVGNGFGAQLLKASATASGKLPPDDGTL
jgi:hypothetical protein